MARGAPEGVLRAPLPPAPGADAVRGRARDVALRPLRRFLRRRARGGAGLAPRAAAAGYRPGHDRGVRGAHRGRRGGRGAALAALAPERRVALRDRARRRRGRGDPGTGAARRAPRGRGGAGQGRAEGPRARAPRGGGAPALARRGERGIADPHRRALGHGGGWALHGGMDRERAGARAPAPRHPGGRAAGPRDPRARRRPGARRGGAGLELAAAPRRLVSPDHVAAPVPPWSASRRRANRTT